MQQLAQPQRHIQHHILLLNPIHAQRARVMPAMPGIDHNPPNLQSQRPHQRSLAIRRRHRRPRRSSIRHHSRRTPRLRLALPRLLRAIQHRRSRHNAGCPIRDSPIVTGGIRPTSGAALIPASIWTGCTSSAVAGLPRTSSLGPRTRIRHHRRDRLRSRLAGCVHAPRQIAHRRNFSRTRLLQRNRIRHRRRSLRALLRSAHRRQYRPRLLPHEYQ